MEEDQQGRESGPVPATSDSQSSIPKTRRSRLPELPLFERFLNPNFIPIFFHGFSARFFGLWVRNGLGSLDGGVVGGVMSSPLLVLDPESSVRPKSPAP